MYLEDFREIVQKLEEDHSGMELYISSLREVDPALSEFICENKYVDIQYWQNRFLLHKLLGKDLLDWVEWYLYELPVVDFDFDENETNCSVNGVKYLVKDLDSFMQFAQHALCLPMKPEYE